MFGYIYITFDQLNGKFYIGQRRGKFNSNYLGSGVRLTRAIKKYGKEYFVPRFIKYCNTRKELNDEEKELIFKIKNRFKNDCYNIARGGECGVPIKGTKEYNEYIKYRSKYSKEHNHINNMKGKNIKQRKYLNILTYEFLYQKYIKENMTAFDIEKEININRITILRYLKYYNIIKSKGKIKENMMKHMNKMIKISSELRLKNNIKQSISLFENIKHLKSFTIDTVSKILKICTRSCYKNINILLKIGYIIKLKTKGKYSFSYSDWT